MDERIKEKLINRAKTNPYVNFLGIDFTVIEEASRRFRRLYDDPAGERRADGRVENVFLTGRLGQ